MARAIDALALTARTNPLLPGLPPTVAAAPMTIPRIVSAPSKAPMTKYRRTMGPRSVTSSSSRHHSRIWRKLISHARGQEREDFPPCSLQGRIKSLDLRAAALREIGPPSPLAAEDVRRGDEDRGGIHAPLGAPGDDDARGLTRRPEDRNEGRRLRKLFRDREEVVHRSRDPMDDHFH